MRLTMVKGLQGSGKSTFCNALVEKYPDSWVSICKDDIRRELQGDNTSKPKENRVIEERDKRIRDALTRGLNVISSDTNLNSIHEKRLREIAQEFGADFEIKYFDVPIAECIRRDSLRTGSARVGEKVIRSTANQYGIGESGLIPRPLKEVNKDLPFCVIIDLDGTIAKFNGRSPYDYDKLHTDTVIFPVKRLLDYLMYVSTDIRNPYAERGEEPYIFIVSGRPNTYEDQTRKWLQDNYIRYDQLYMRGATRVDENGNQVNDVVIKEEIYNQYIKDKFNVLFAIDDRKRIKRLWVKNGIFVLDVNQYDIEF